MKKSKNSSQQLSLFATSFENTCFSNSSKQVTYPQIKENIRCKVISLEDYRHIKDTELKNTFYSLSDHLD